MTCCNDEHSSRADDDDDDESIDDTFERPIRVIDIGRTLANKRGVYFVKPKSWDFHVLSHTWSLHVRQLSELIGARIGASQDWNAYNHAFAMEDFSKELCFNQLLELFDLLQADRVKFIWFDALCINQTSVDEKSHEINNMGPYFSLSLGTYVLMHGVGELNELWEKGGDRGANLPRWFTRVWTFQEFLLPRRLSFLVEGGVDKRFAGLINYLIQEKKKSGFCRCFLQMQTKELEGLIMGSSNEEEDLEWLGGFELRNPKWKSIRQITNERAPHESVFCDDGVDTQKWIHGLTHYGYQDMCKECDNTTNKKYCRDLLAEKMQNNKKLHPKVVASREITNCGNAKSIICSSDITCKDCDSRPLIRRAKNLPGHEKITYFVDSEVFLALMQCDSRMVEKKGNKEADASEAIQALRGLYCALGTEGNWRPCHVICEVGWRECSVEEDRVLSVLGLLGLRLRSLRTGNTLRSQLLQLTLAGGSAMLLEFCLVNQKGGSAPCMSWAPDFHGHNVKLEYASRPRHVSWQVQHLHPHGGQLQVKVKMACGKVEPITSNNNQYHLLVDAIGDNVESNTRKKIYLPLDLNRLIIEYPKEADEDQRHRHILHYEFKQQEMHGVSGSFELPTLKKIDGDVSFFVRLLLLGEDEVGRKLFLICLPEKSSTSTPKFHEELHKIGCISITDLPSTLQSTFDTSDFHPCVIGGFGKDLTDYIHLHQ